MFAIIVTLSDFGEQATIARYGRPIRWPGDHVAVRLQSDGGGLLLLQALCLPWDVANGLRTDGGPTP